MYCAKFPIIAALAIAVLPVGALAQSGKKSSAGSAPVTYPACGSVAFVDGTMACNCPAGAASGSVWGSGPYTADSSICAAARHAGAIGDAGGNVRLFQRDGQSSYAGSTVNGVTTSNWGSYGQSFDIVAADGRAPVQTMALPQCGTMPAAVSEYACVCPADGAAGAVWGNGPYTSDSDICTAARHNGYIDARGGEVYVLRLQELAGYVGALVMA